MRLRLQSLSAWIINLDRSPDRWVRCFHSLASVLPSERLQRISAVDGREFASRESDAVQGWKPAFLARLRNEGFVGGEAVLDPVRTALCLSHQRALQAFLDSRERWGLIFEDDSRPASAISQVLAEDGILEPPDNAEILFLHDRVRFHGGAAGSHGTPQSGRLFWRVVRGGIGMEAYAVNVSGAQKMLEALRPVVIECDVQMMAFMEGYARTEDKEGIKNLLRQAGRKTFPSMRAFAPHLPLFQSDPQVPSVKIATLAETAAVGSPRGAAAPVGSSLSLNTNHSLGLAAVWFNPAGFRSRRENFLRFYEGVQEYSDRLAIVELAFNDEPWQIPDGLPNLVRLRSNTICWQKEALINHAFNILSQAGFAELGWLDADIMFNSDGWYEKAQEVLNRRRLCQLFSSVVTNFPDVGLRFRNGPAYEWVARARAPLNNPCTGYGWAMRREVWESARLFDLDIVGGGDHTLWHAVFANYLKMQTIFQTRGMSEKFCKVRAEWAHRWSKAVAMEIGYVPDIGVRALPHGSLRNRSYAEREDILKTHCFDPLLHIERDDAGLLRWTAAAPAAFRDAVMRYFVERSEDSAS